MPAIQPYHPIDPNPMPSLAERLVYRQTNRGLARVAGETRLRLAAVQAEGLVQTAKLHEVDNLGREAVTGHALLRRWADTLAAGDPFLADELKLFTDTARLGKAEVMADTISTYCRESRR